MRMAIAGGTGVLGRLLVERAAERGHEVRVLSRSTGVDLVRGTGVEAALEGCAVVLDALSTPTVSARASTAFFTASTRTLLAAGARAGVGHHVVVSIIGVDRAPVGYWAGKRAQEQLVEAGPLPWTVLRAAQFHEFVPQVLARAALGPLHFAPRMRLQPVAAVEVAARLVELAEGGPAGRRPDLAGPREEWLPALARACARAAGLRGPLVTATLPGAFGRAMRDGAALPGPDASRGRETFAQWLDRRVPADRSRPSSTAADSR